MKIKQISFIFILMTIFMLAVQPLQASADGKYPVRITGQTMVVYPVDETSVQVIQSMNFENSGTEKEDQLPIYLPENYADLQLGEGLTEQNIENTSKGITDITGLDAGEEKQLIVSYKMPMSSGSSRWAIEQSYVTGQVQVVIQTGVLSFSASNLYTQSDLFEMNDQEFRRFTRMDVHPDQPWTLDFKMLNKPAQQEMATTEADAKYTEDGLKVIGGEGFGYGKAIFTFIIIIIALAAALIGLKRDLLRTTGKHAKINRSWLVNEKTMLLKEIVQLEKDYRADLITDSTYEKAREKIREHLVRITMELG